MKNKEEFLKKVGLNIKQIRKTKNQEVKEAAVGLGVTVQTVGAIENGLHLHVRRQGCADLRWMVAVVIDDGQWLR